MPSLTPARMISAFDILMSGARIVTGPALDARLGAEPRHLLHRRQPLGPAVGVAGRIEHVDPDDDLGGAAHLGQRDRVGQEDRVARRDVGDRNAAADLGLVAPLGDGDVRGQRRAADGAQVEVDDVVRRGAQRGRRRARPPPARRRAAGRSESSARDSGVRRRGSWPARWPNRCRPTAARSRRSCRRRLTRRCRRAILSRMPCSTTGSTGGAATTCASTARSPTSAAARCWTSAAAPGGCWCRCCAPATPSSASTARPRCWPARRRASAGWRRARAAARCCCARDLRALAFAPRFAFAVAAFHSIQHLETDADLARFFAGAARALIPGGWLAFDTFAPDARFLGRATPRRAGRRWGRTRFAHPATGRPIAYSESYRLAGGC